MHWTAAALAGMVVYLDTTAVGQLMICQPLIACPLYGLLMGRPEIGLFFGVGFQLLWLGSLPIGAAKFPEGNVGALIATATAASVPATAAGEPAWFVLAIATMAGVLASYLGGEATPLVRKAMNHVAPRVVSAAAADDRLQFRLLVLGAVAIHALTGALLALVGYGFGRALLALYLGDYAALGVPTSIVEATDSLFSGLWPGLLGAGAAVLFARFVRKRNVVAYGLIAASAGGLAWLTL
ncbi:PTS sugar transporter subunit IIC [candidate division KSB1 bacterium]|nr:PTS sugar transporter subunit IIC [candidate division KSB1 bacterium]